MVRPQQTRRRPGGTRNIYKPAARQLCFRVMASHCLSLMEQLIG
jgi:hypothetical protein